MQRERVLQLRAADEHAWLVFADELMAQGDPRGELIRLQLELARATGAAVARLRRRESALFAAHQSELLGPGGVLSSVSPTWRRGYISSARSPTASAMRTLLTHPSGTFLDELVLENPHLALDEQVDAVGRCKPSALRALTIRSDDTVTRFEGQIPLARVFDLPALETLSAHVRSMDLGGRAGTSQLVHLDLSARHLRLELLAAWTFPSLRALQLSSFNNATARFGDIATDPPPLTVPERLTRGVAAPALEALVLGQFLLTRDAVLALASLAGLGALRRLDLSDCTAEVAAWSALDEVARGSLKLTLPRAPVAED